MGPLETPEGRAHVERHLRWLPLAVDDEVHVTLGFDKQPPLLGMAWTHDEETGWLDELRVLVDAPGAGDPERPLTWSMETFHGVEREDEAQGARLVEAMRTAGDANPEETIAAAVAAALRPEHWEELHPAPGFVLWTRRGGRWQPAGAPQPPPAQPDLPHLARWVSDDALAARLRVHIEAIAAAVRAAFAQHPPASPLCAVGLLPGGGMASTGYVFGLTQARLDAEDDPEGLLESPADWDLDPLADEGPLTEESEALEAALEEAGVFDESAFLREVADVLRAGDWPGVAATPDLRVVVG